MDHPIVSDHRRQWRSPMLILMLHLPIIWNADLNLYTYIQIKVPILNLSIKYTYILNQFYTTLTVLLEL